MKSSILIVEDDPLVRESLYEILNLEGYEVVMAQDGKTAIGKINEKAIDVALVDLRLRISTALIFSNGSAKKPLIWMW